MKHTLPLAAVRALYDVYADVRAGRPATLEPVAEHDPLLRQVLGLPERWPSGDDVLDEVRSYLDQPDATDGGPEQGATP